MDLRKIFALIPEVKNPEEKKVGFNKKLKWTIAILITFFILVNIPLFGLSSNALERFEYLATILGTQFGSIVSLGIGPIVMASIILQLLVGAGIINIDSSTTEGKKFFQGLQKIMVIFFIVFEALVYVLLQGLQPSPELGTAGPILLVIQLILGGLGIYYMSEVVQKWGFGSGVSLFIAGGVSLRLFTSSFQFITQQGKNCLLDFQGTACPGKVLTVIQAVINKYPLEFLSAGAAILVTILVFLIVVWAQSLKVEVPLSYGRVRGYGVKWPLKFFYASVIPVILTSALIANIQLFGGMIENAAAPCLEGTCTGIARFASYFDFLGSFSNGRAVSGFAFWLGSSNILELAIRGGLSARYFFQGISHILVYMFFATIFSIFWVKTSNLDAKSQAQKIANSGLQVAGFRQDTRVLESILSRYILPLTVMGGASIGLLASFTNLMGALVSGTAILLVIMIMFQIYQGIAQQHAEDMNPAFRKFMGS